MKKSNSQESNKKFTEVLNVNDFEILTDDGWQDIKTSNKTIPYHVHIIRTENYILRGADNHIIFDKDMNEVFIKDTKLRQLIHTKTGLEEIVQIEVTPQLEEMYDLQLYENSDRRYYTSGILSHNTTLGLDIVCNTKPEGATALFISAEMNSIDMYEYMERYPKFGKIDILFLGDYTDENPKLVIEAVLKKGYDVVLGDSFAEIQDEVQESCFMSSKAVEKWLIDLMCSHNKGENDTKSYTTFIMIQQMTKGGKFVGSNKLKHNTTGMLEVRFDGGSELAPRYIEFSKNRRGNVNRKLYFTLDQADHVNYLEDRWHMEEENRMKMRDELAGLAEEADTFDELLKLDPESKSEECEEVESENETPVETEELVEDNVEAVDLNQ